MAIDPKLSSDECIYLEAEASDNGVHNVNGVWYFSPDVILTDSAGTPTNEAKKGMEHQICVRVRKRVGCSLDSEWIRVEAYVAVPSTTINSHNLKQVVLPKDCPVDKSLAKVEIDGFHAVEEEDGYKDDGFVHFKWTPSSDKPEDPDGPGHRCLIARCYPTNLDPSGNFFLPDDPHIVQHNIDIIKVRSSATVPPVQIAAANASPDKVALVQLKVNSVLNPSPKLQAHLQDVLRIEPEFHQIAMLPYQEILQLQVNNDLATLNEKVATLIPSGFRIDVPGFPLARFRDFSHPKSALDSLGRVYPKRFVTEFNLEPQQLTFFEFAPEPFKSKPGTSHVFNVVQYDDGEPTGGIVLVYIVTE